MNHESTRQTADTGAAVPDFLAVATQAASAGLSVLPCVADGTDAGKRPLAYWQDGAGKPTWKPAQTECASPYLLKLWYTSGHRTSLGTVTGVVSGNLEAADFDAAELYPVILDAAAVAGLGPLVQRITNGYSDRTPGGYRWLWRCEEIAGNQKLATCPDADGGVQVLIETRGEGGYAILAPSNGKTHPTGKPYTRLAGDFASIATITPEERRDLLAFLKTFHQPVETKEPPAGQHTASRAGPGGRPGDDFNQRESWRNLLEPAGWQFVYRRDGADYWRRPGKQSGVSACTGWQGGDSFYVWSSSTEFKTETPYSKFAFYATLYHGGDFKAATKALAELGFGEPRQVKGNGPDSAPPARELPPAEAYEDPASSRPVIYSKGGELPAMVDMAECALLASPGDKLFQRGSFLVRTARTASDNVTGHIRRQAGSLQIIPVDAGYLLERFTQVATWLKFEERKSKWKPTNAPRLAVDTYLSRFGRWKVPALTGIIESPTLRPDGSILETPGYDPITGLILDPGSTRFEPIPVNPSQEDARQAVKILEDVISGFPFVAEHDRAVILAAILTALIRKILRSAPLFGFTAPVMGTGKSLLADLVAIIATGRRAAAWTYTDDPEETRKHSTAALLAGDQVICVDNASVPLESDRLSSILTQESIRDRLLGGMKEVTLSTAATWLVTGNNLEILGDLATRALVCRVDAVTENPEEREFQTDLLTWVPDNRAALVHAALTILRAYHVAGRPKQPIKQFGRFEDWSNLVRSALVWTGVTDPCKARIQVAAADPKRQQLAALLSAWYAVFKDQPVTTAEIIRAARVEVTGGEETYGTAKGEELRGALLAIAGQGETINPRSFAKYLIKNRDRIINGFRLEQVGIRSDRVLWQVRTVSTVSTVCSNPTWKNVTLQNVMDKEVLQTDKNGIAVSENRSNRSNRSNRPPPEPPPPAMFDAETAKVAAPTYQQFVFYLNNGQQKPYTPDEPITLSMATIAGRKLYGERFGYTEVQEVQS